jgi:hypothetical protein
MNRVAKGFVIAAIQAALVASLGAKLLYDRSTRPRVWVQAAPFDPDLPIRGRYVSLQLAVELRGIAPNGADRRSPASVTLHVEGDRLVAEADEQQRRYVPSDLHVRVVQRSGETLAVLDQPVAFFIPEHVADPSRRPPGEKLWVEATIPRKGPPRPIRLGVKKDDGAIEPLVLE